MAPFSNLIDTMIRVLGDPEIKFIPKGGVAVSARAVFTQTGAEVAPNGTVVTVSRPMLFLDLRPLAMSPRSGDRFIVKGQNYSVTNVVKDGVGAAVISLEESHV